MMKALYRHLMVSLLLVMALIPMPLAAQSSTDEVMISDCSEVYEFKMKSGQPVVKNRITIEFQTLREYDMKIQPAVFYGDNIKLDASRCLGTPQYKSATPDNVFFDDSRVCYYDVTLNRMNKTCKATFERTFTDLHYFTRVVLGEQYFVKHKMVTFIFPKGFEQYQLINKNMSPAVAIEHKNKGGSRVVTYTINDMAPIKQEEAMPPVASVYPTVYVTGSFKDANDLFAWGSKLANVDTAIPSLNEILADIERDSKTDLDRIKNTYAWVQNNIRYVAFEEGISGHQPDRPAEMVRKRYGDCKGMALLLKTLFTAQGYDARLTDVGTVEAACRMSEVPTLAAVNHAICTLEWQGKSYYLDATCNHIPLGHIPSNIQGVEAMVEQPDGSSSLKVLPVLPINANCDSVHISLTLDKEGQLTGGITRHLKGDMKEFMLSAYDSQEAQKRLLIERNALNDHDHANQVDDATWMNKDCRSEWAILTGRMTDTHSVERIDGELFVELDPDNMLFANPIDTAKRMNDYLLPMPCRQVREVAFTLPEGYRCDQLPEDFNLKNQYADLTCTWQRIGGTIIYRKVMNLHKHHINRADIPAWNAHLKQWQASSHEAIVLTQTTKTQ